MAQTVLGNVVVFLDKIGIYEVVLPFLLVFTIIFAILERTQVFGTETIHGKPYTRKNVNSLVAFCVAFFVIASSQLVQIITQVSSQVVVLLLSSVFFLILIGSFHKEGEISLSGEDKAGWRNLFMVIMFIGIVLIFLQAIKLSNGQSWLEFGLDWFVRNISSGAVASIVLLIGVVVFMAWITRKEEGGKPKEKKGQ